MPSGQDALAGVLGNGSVAVAARLDPVAVDGGGGAGRKAALARQLLAVVVDVLEVEGVQVAGEVAEDGQTDVDQEVWPFALATTRQRAEQCRAGPGNRTHATSGDGIHADRRDCLLRATKRQFRNMSSRDSVWGRARERVRTQNGDDNQENGGGGAHLGGIRRYTGYWGRCVCDG